MTRIDRRIAITMIAVILVIVLVVVGNLVLLALELALEQ